MSHVGLHLRLNQHGDLLCLGDGRHILIVPMVQLLNILTKNNSNLQIKIESHEDSVYDANKTFHIDFSGTSDGRSFQ